MVYALWEPLVAWGVLLALQQHFANDLRPFDRLRQRLGQRAYAWYIIHPPVLVGIALALLDIHATQLTKFALTSSTTCVVCYLLAGFIVRLPGVRRIV